MNPVTPVTPRKRRVLENPPVYRVPQGLSDRVYLTYGKCHKQKLTSGTMVFAARMLREESFNRRELLSIKSIIEGDEETAPLSGEILGSSETTAWVEACLSGHVKPQ